MNSKLQAVFSLIFSKVFSGRIDELMPWKSLLRVITCLLLFVSQAQAQTITTFTFTVPLNQGQVTEDRLGYDTWLTPWQNVGYTLPTGDKVRFDVLFPTGERIDTTDGTLYTGNESIHVNVRGHYPAGTTPPGWPDNQLQVDYWLTGVTPVDPGPKVPTQAHPWTSWKTPYPAVVNPATGDINYEHDYDMGTAPFSFTDVHVELTATSLLFDYVIDEVQIGFDRDNIYTTVPEPVSILLLGTGLVGLFGARNRRKKK